MFQRQIFGILEKAYIAYTSPAADESEGKPGLAIGIYYSLIRAAKF